MIQFQYILFRVFPLLLSPREFSLICVWIKDWVNNREAGDLRRYRAHCDVIVVIQQNLAYEKAILVEVMVCCCQSTSHIAWTNFDPDLRRRIVSLGPMIVVWSADRRFIWFHRIFTLDEAVHSKLTNSSLTVNSLRPSDAYMRR